MIYHRDVFLSQELQIAKYHHPINLARQVRILRSVSLQCKMRQHASEASRNEERSSECCLFCKKEQTVIRIGNPGSFLINSMICYFGD